MNIIRYRMAVLDQDRVDVIKRHLRWHPRGMTITDLAFDLKMNRNLMAKYLDMLLVAGQVEVRTAGPTKVYSLSQRVPISAMLEFSSDLVIVLDAKGTVIQVNEPVVKLLGTTREPLIGNPVHAIDNPIFSCLPVPEPDNHGKPAGEKVLETSYTLGGKEYHFRVKLVQTAFEDGSTGTTCIAEDITAKKRADARIAGYIKNLEFLARTSAKFADMGDDEDIYQYIADRLIELEPKAHAVVMAINPDTKTSAIRAFAGDTEFTGVMLRYFGDFLVGKVSMEKAPDLWGDIAKGALVQGPESLYVQTFRMFPEQICNEIQERISMGKSYAMSCMCRMGIYGGIALRYRFSDDVQNRETVEAFIRQAGVALQRRHMRENLRVAEERISRQKGTPAPAGAGMPLPGPGDGT